MVLVVQSEMKAAVKEKLSKQYGDLVMRLLTLAIAGGYRDRAALERSEDFRWLREREDYVTLLKKLATPPSTSP
jgi:hypothetical protein